MAASCPNMDRAITCLWAYTTLPSSFHVPPLRSIRTIRKIWKKRRPRNALVANTWPDVPIPITTIDAPIVITSTEETKQKTTTYFTTGLQHMARMILIQAYGMRRLTYNTKWSFEEFQTTYAALISWPTSWWPQSVPVHEHRNEINHKSLVKSWNFPLQ